MALYASVNQPLVALANQPCTFTYTVTNTGGSDVDIDSCSLVITGPSGVPSMSARAAPAFFPPGRSPTVTAAGTLLVPLQAVFFGGGAGGGADASDQFLVSAQFLFSDGTSYTTDPKLIGLSENTSPAAAPTFQFGYALNSQYLPFFL